MERARTSGNRNLKGERPGRFSASAGRSTLPSVVSNPSLSAKEMMVLWILMLGTREMIRKVDGRLQYGVNDVQTYDTISWAIRELEEERILTDSELLDVAAVMVARGLIALGAGDVMVLTTRGAEAGSVALRQFSAARGGQFKRGRA